MIFSVLTLVCQTFYNHRLYIYFSTFNRHTERGAGLTSHIHTIASWLHWQHRLLVGIALVLVFIVRAENAFAQDAVTIDDEGPTLAASPFARELSVHDTSGTSADTLTNTDDQKALEVGRPPLPFRTPQIGPFIKQISMENIEQRTTAFIPTSLDHLTDLEHPEEKRWIRVDLSEQTVVAYQDGEPIRGFIVSTGLPGTPTVSGEFRIRMKVNQQTMYGGEGSMAYNLPGVKWVQYFYEDYGFHGTYWHSNFGNPMSHGCINMTDADAKWLFDWAGPVWDGETDWYPSTQENPGTLVLITE